ncbi:MAG: hypothetical protein ACXW4C_12225, partial [Nitrospira sp.]
ASTRQGFYWWEIDMTYYCLKGLEWMGLVWDIRGVPEYVREGKTKQDSDRSVLKKKIDAAVKATELPASQPELELTPR